MLLFKYILNVNENVLVILLIFSCIFFIEISLYFLVVFYGYLLSKFVMMFGVFLRFNV